MRGGGKSSQSLDLIVDGDDWWMTQTEIPVAGIVRIIQPVSVLVNL